MRRVILLASIVFLVFGTIKAQLPNAQDIAGKMKIGWNLGNTLEVVWGDPGTTTQRVIDSVKAAGFNSVRLPCAWDYHAINGVIDTNWMAKVKKVVDYCIKDSLYTMINIHWDKGWLDEHINVTDQPVIIEKQKNYWTQIANYFKEYDEHLLFASANEPPVHDKDTVAMAVLMSYHQAFVDAVRATGGNNSSRTLIIQAPSTNIELAISLMNSMPVDSIEKRLMVEVHSYGPYPFGLMTEDADWGKMAYYWGSPNHSTTDKSRNITWGEESDFDKWFGLMKTKFTDKGIPVILGEFGAIKRSKSSVLNYELHLESRKYFNNYVVFSAIKNGIVPVYWDNAWTDFGIIDRTTGAIIDQQVVDGLMLGTQEIVRTSNLRLVNRGSGLVISTNGNNATQSKKDSVLSQQWVLETVADYVRIKNCATGFYLGANGVSIVDTSDNQKWIEEVSLSYVKFKNKATGLYLDGLGKTENGSELGQTEKSTNKNQTWIISSIINEPAVPMTTDVQALKKNENFEVFPNPFSSTFNLKVENPNKIVGVSVYDLLGKQVETLAQSAINENMTLGSNLKPGIYIVKISGADWAKALQILKK